MARKDAKRGILVHLSKLKYYSLIYLFHFYFINSIYTIEIYEKSLQESSIENFDAYQGSAWRLW